MPDVIHLPRTPHARPGPGPIVHIWLVLAGAAVIAIVGLIDDAVELRPQWKLLGEIIAALVAVKGGVAVTDVTLPFIGPLQFPHGGGALSVLWMVGMMNVINFSDGVDGLAAGLSAIDGVAFAVIAFALHVWPAGVLAALTAGAALGFLMHNFPPASVFMGDSGALLLGYLLGAVAVVGSVKTNAVVALIVPLVILAVPFLDTGFVVAKRLKYHRVPWAADANHFHHRMARIGFSPRRTVAYMYAWSILLAGVAVALKFVPYHNHHPSYYRWGWVAFLAGLFLLAAAASVYLVYVLEILKFRHRRFIQIRSDDPTTSEHEVVERVRRDVETGEFERVRR
jgi:UDP-GlcNAc:undecaprenyl-phosphate GlcNAc-1-phosphate transferase